MCWGGHSTGQGGQVTQKDRVTEVRPEWLKPGYGPIAHGGVQGIHKWVKAPRRSPALTVGHLSSLCAGTVAVNGINFSSLDSIKNLFLRIFYKSSTATVTLQSLHPLLWSQGPGP